MQTSRNSIIHANKPNKTASLFPSIGTETPKREILEDYTKKTSLNHSDLHTIIFEVSYLLRRDETKNHKPNRNIDRHTDS